MADEIKGKSLHIFIVMKIKLKTILFFVARSGHAVIPQDKSQKIDVPNHVTTAFIF